MTSISFGAKPRDVNVALMYYHQSAFTLCTAGPVCLMSNFVFFVNKLKKRTLYQVTTDTFPRTFELCIVLHICCACKIYSPHTWVGPCLGVESPWGSREELVTIHLQQDLCTWFSRRVASACCCL